MSDLKSGAIKISEHLEPKMSALTESISAKFSSFLDICFNRSNNADKFANCVYDMNERLEKENNLLTLRVSYILASYEKCMASKDEATCVAESIKAGNDVAANFNKFMEKL